MTAKEALKDLREVRGWNDSEYNKRLDIIKSALKDYEMEHTLRIRSANINYELGQVLKIIKEKGINTLCLESTDNADEYRELTKSHLGMKRLTEKEYDLLKEVLK